MLQYDFNWTNSGNEDLRISVIGEGKAKRIDDLLKDHVKEARKYMALRYKALAPPNIGPYQRGSTGDLQKALNRGLVKKGADGHWGFEAFVSPITEGRTAPESLYPLFVEKGTKGPIKATQGNVLALRDKSRGRRIFAFKESVKGQPAQNYFSRTVTAVKFQFYDAVSQRRIVRQIEDIVYGPDLD